MRIITLVLTGSLVLVSAPPAAAAPGDVTVHRLQRTATLPLVLVALTPTDRTWFAIDTGATGTTVTPDVAARLAVAATAQVRLATVTGETTVGVVRLGLTIVGRQEQHAVDAALHDLTDLRRLAPDAEGILGQDVLSAYDYLIDFEGGWLRLGRFDPPPRGVALPLSWSAGRPLVHVAGRLASHRLVLDTGADALYIAQAASGDAVGVGPVGEARQATLHTHFGEAVVEVEAHRALRFDALWVGAVQVVRLPSRLWQQRPEVGLLPASVFRQVYVSARSGRAEVWPRR